MPSKFTPPQQEFLAGYLPTYVDKKSRGKKQNFLASVNDEYMLQWPVVLPSNWAPDPNAEIEDTNPKDAEGGDGNSTPDADDSAASDGVNERVEGGSAGDSEAPKPPKPRKMRKMTEQEQRDAALGVLRGELAKVCVQGVLRRSRLTTSFEENSALLPKHC